MRMRFKIKKKKALQFKMQALLLVDDDNDSHNDIVACLTFLVQETDNKPNRATHDN